MSSIELRFHRAAIADIEARISALSIDLGEGAASDWADYQNRVGQIIGLNAALDCLDVVWKNLFGKQEEFRSEI